MKTAINPIRRFFQVRFSLVPKVLRVFAFLLFVHLLIGAYLVHSAYADMKEAFFSIGSEIMRYAEANRQDAPRKVQINGHNVHLSVGSTDKSVKEVLDHFAGVCRRRSGKLDTWLRANKVPKGRIRHLKASGLLEPMFRQEGDSKGVIACLDLGEEEIGMSELVNRLREFSEGGDLRSLGRLRYAFVERGEKSTTFALMWNEGSFNFKKMFPSTGDAPGQDIEGVSRIKGLRRVLSAAEVGYPQALAVYAARVTPSTDLEKMYRKRLKAEGWHILNEEQQEKYCQKSSGFVAEKDQQMISVVAGKSDAHRAFVNIMELH